MKVKGERNIECQIKSRVPQGALPGVLLFNIYLNYMFDSIGADLLHFANDNYLSSIGHLMVEAKALLINETVVSSN